MRQGLLNLTKLPYAPLPQSGATTETMAATGFIRYTAPSSGKDLIVKSAGGRKRGMEAKEWRTARMIGASIDLTLEGATKSENGVQFRRIEREAFLEGLYLKGAQGGETGERIDMLNAGGSSTEPWPFKPTVTLQNLHIVGAVGDDEHTPHPDCYEPQHSTGVIRMYNITFYAGYQGIFIPAQKPMGPAYLSNVNGRYQGAAHGYQYWLLGYSEELGELSEGGANGPIPKCNPRPVYLTNCYSAEDGTGRELAQRVFPGPGYEGEIEGVMHDIGCEIKEEGGRKYAEWPAITQIHGRIWDGLPPGEANFVPAASVGDGYVSPGYRT